MFCAPLLTVPSLVRLLSVTFYLAARSENLTNNALTALTSLTSLRRFTSSRVQVFLWFFYHFYASSSQPSTLSLWQGLSICGYTHTHTLEVHTGENNLKPPQNDKETPGAVKKQQLPDCEPENGWTRQGDPPPPKRQFWTWGGAQIDSTWAAFSCC